MVGPILGREAALSLLREHMPVLRERYGVAELSLFGSTARDEATAESDVDVLVRFDREPETSWGCYEAQSYLSDLFGRQVDMVERRLMRKEYMPWVEADAVDPLNPRPHTPDRSRPMRWDVYIQDMQKDCRQVLDFTAGMDYEAYLSDVKTTAATSFSLSQIGEAAGKIPGDVRDSHPEIDWNRMIGLRHVIVHAYYDIEFDKLWEIIRDHIPELSKRLVPLLAEAQEKAREAGGSPLGARDREA